MSDRDDLNRVLHERLFERILCRYCKDAWYQQPHIYHNEHRFNREVPDYAGTWEGAGLVLEAM